MILKERDLGLLLSAFKDALKNFGFAFVMGPEDFPCIGEGVFHICFTVKMVLQE